MSETDAAEAKRRAEWLHKHKAHKDWVILSVSEIAVIRAELEATERERDEARELLASEKITRDHVIKRGIEMQKERDEAREALEFRRELYKVQEQCLETARRERDEARHKLELCMAANSDVARIAKERNEALDQVKELIYIAERAIALAEIDFENDKFGVVSELRDDLAKIKKSK